MDRAFGPAVAAALVVAAACVVMPAHASPPAASCVYECLWPAGSYSIPKEVVAGETFEIAWTYSWEPRGGHAGSEHADTPPPGYTGSTARLRLPQELEVLDAQAAGFRQERLWVDHYGRAMYEYTRANTYSPSGTHSQAVMVRLDGAGMFYPVTEIVVDLGLSERDAPPGLLYVARRDGGATIAAEPPAVPVGLAESYPHRQALKWPPPRMEAPPPGGAASGMQAAGDDETHAYGHFYASRDTPAADVRACLYDRGQGTTMTPIIRNGAAACTQTSPDGFYSLVFPREDPDGDGTDADVTVRFTVEGTNAAVMTRGQPVGEPYSMYVDAPNMALSAELPMGMAIAPFVTGMESAIQAYMAINRAHAYFLNTFSYDAPHAVVQNHSGGAGYRILDEIIFVRIATPGSNPLHDSTLYHEYGHHIMAQTAGIPQTEFCHPHTFNGQSSESCAWVEGWAEFVSGLVAGSHIVDRGRVGFDLEAPGTNEEYGLYTSEIGPDVEGRVAGVLWDIHDSGNGEAHDDIHGGAQLIWDVLLDEPGPGERHPAASIHDFLDDWEDARYPSLDGILRQNGLAVGEGVAMSVIEAGGDTKSGGGKAHAMAGETVRVTIALDAPAGAAPSMSFYGAAPTSMSPAGAAGSWRAEHVVTGSTREGQVSFAVSLGGETVATLHDVDAVGRVVVDRIAPRALSAKFVAPDSIVVMFSEPVVLPGSDAFVATPPGSAAAPSVSASLSEEGTKATLTLAPAASINGDWSVAVPGTLADSAGNAHGAGSVTAKFLADGAPPTFTATRVSATQIAIEFNEDIRAPQDENAHLPSFVLVGERTITASLIFFDYPNRRMTLAFGENVFAGTLFYRLAGGTETYFEDLLGNAVADGTSATVPESTTPMFTVLSSNLIDLNIPAPPVVVRFATPVIGTTGVSDWRVNGKQPEYFSFGPANIRGDTRAFPLTAFTASSFAELHLHVDIPPCDGYVQVEYVAPDSNPLSSASGAVNLEDMSASDVCDRLVPHKATFLDSRTISVVFDRPPRDLDLDSFLVDGLGPALGHQAHGSREVTLHVRDAAVSGATYAVTNNDIRDTAELRSALRPVLMSIKATYEDKTPPTVTVEYGESVGADGRLRVTHIKLYLSEPLDANTLAGKAFTGVVPDRGSSASSYPGGFSAHYLSGERVVYLIPQDEIGRRGVRVSIPAGIADVNGVAIGAQEISATHYRSPASGAVATGERTVRATVSMPLSEESLKHVRISPSVGNLEVSQDGNTLTITGEEHFRHGRRYSIVIPPEAETDSGRKVGSVFPHLRFVYSDGTAPTATARFSTPREITIALSEPLDARTVTQGAFSVTPPLGLLGAKYADGGLEVILEASEPARSGTEYAVGVSGVEDRAGLPLSPATLRVSLEASAIFTGAAFTSPNTIEVKASAPLNPGTFGGISVSGLGQATAGYNGATRTVTLSTTRTAEVGDAHRVFIPDTVLAAGGEAAGPVVLEAVNRVGGGPAVVEAWTALDGHVAVSFDRRVGPALGLPGSLDASRWKVMPAGGDAVAASSAVAAGRTVWLQYGAESDLDRIKRDRTIYMDAWNPRAAADVEGMAVSYTPSSGAGDVADRTVARNPLAATNLPVKDRLPPTFSAKTTRGATVVTFDGAVSGATSAVDWLVAGAPATGVSSLGRDADVPASGAAWASLPMGTTRIALHHAKAAPDDRPLVSYAPQGSALAIVSGGIPMAPWITRAADGAGPSTIDAAFTGPKTLLVSFDEALKTASVSRVAFEVTGPTGTAVAVIRADHTPHSRTVSLGLESDASPGKHVVRATGVITDAHGNPAAGSGSAIAATYATAATGEPTISARTVTGASVTVTFDPPVSGTTSGDAWEVRGVASRGVLAVGGVAVPDPGATSITLPRGTTTITLDAPLGGTADEPIVRYIGTGIAAGSVPLGGRAAMASDGAPPQVQSVVGTGGAARVGLSEPIAFSGGVAADRNGRWSGMGADDGRTVPLTVSTDGHSAIAIRAREVLASIRYDGSVTTGAIMDASGNFLDMGRWNVASLDPAGLDFYVRGSQDAPFGIYAGGLGGALVLPGIPVFVFSGSDGDRVGAWRSRDSTTFSVDVTPPLIAGDRYEVALPAFADPMGVTNSETRDFVYGADNSPPTVESARFAGSREVRVEFNEPLAAIPVTAAFSVTPVSGVAIPLAANGVSHEAGLRTVTLSLSTAAISGAHEVRVPTTVTDLPGNAYAAPGTPVTATYDAVAPTAASAAFTGERTVALTVSEALDAATVNLIRVRGLGTTSASYTAGSTTVTLHTQLAAATGSSHAVVIPAGVTDVNGVPLAPTVLWAARSDAAPPAAVGARTTSPTTTEVDFGEAVRLGDSPTPEQHAAHWTVTEAGSDRVVAGAEVVRGGLSVRLTHAPVGTSAAPTISYAAGSNDDASVRDWALTPNYMASTTMDVTAGDGLPPSIDTLTMSVERPGEAAAPARLWARAGDMVRFAMTMSEAAGTDAPVIRLAGMARNMAPSGEGRLSWTHEHTVPPMDATQGVLAFVVSASDGGGNFAHAVAPTSGAAIMVDTVMPTFTARTLGDGLVEVVLSEPVRGTITASEWTVGGTPASGVAASAGSAPRASVILDAGAGFALWHGAAGTGSAPEVRYDPPNPT